MNLFKSKASQPASPDLEPVYDPFASTRAKLNDFLTKNIGKPGPTYGDDRVAPLSDVEQKSLDAANRYADKSAPGQNFNLAQDEIKKTLSGDYDPSTSPYYQAVKAESERNFQLTKDRINDNAAGGRRYFSGLTDDLTARAATDSNIALNKELGALAENERTRRLAAVQPAMQLESYQQDLPLRQAQGLQTVGALPRELQQALLDAVYQEWLQSNVEYPLNIAQLAAGPGSQEPLFVQNGYTARQPAISSQILSLLSV